MLEVILILFLLVVNGVLSMAEIAVVSARKTRLKGLADTGDLGAMAALKLSDNPSQFLATVQIGITLVGILAGAFGGATLSAPLAVLLRNVPFLAPYADQVAFLFVVLIITYFSLLIGELVPKRLGLTNPERIASLVALPMQAISKLTSPLARFLTFSTELVFHLLHLPEKSDQTVTEEEVKIMLDEGTATGVFEPNEREMVGRVFRLGDLDINALMTPRPEIAALDIQDTEETIRSKLSQYGHSRYPVVSGDIENVLGIVTTKDLLVQYLARKPIRLNLLMRPALFVPEGMPALDLLDKFKIEHAQIAMVIDEYGSIQGVVTMNDLAEAVVGDVELPDDKQEAEIVQREDGSWLVDGRLPTHEFKEKMDIQTLPDEQDGYYQTLGGFVMAMLGRIPKAGDVFDWDGWRVEVMDMDGRRVDKVLVARTGEVAPNAA